MALAEDPRSALAFKEKGDLALRGGDLAGARMNFVEAVRLAPDRLDAWMGLAAAQRALGDLQAGLEATEGALAVEPRCFPALLLKGSLLEALGHQRQAAVVYGIATKLAPSGAELSEPTRRALAHATEVHRRHADELAARLLAAADLEGAEPGVAGRAAVFIDAAAGRRKVFNQEPVQFHYPGLPAIEFYDRAEFPWLADLEACTEAIREEVLAVWSDGSPDLEPYIDYPPSVPVDQWAELNHSLRWSAFHLWREGQPVETARSKCPHTFETLKIIDQPRVAGRSPAAMFSILRPRTRIPCHTGVSNTRLVLHLPLIVPEGCGFRVGGETRQWREGEAWVFDDTIDHEAWNDSDKPRAILICDVWSPRLSAEERELIVTITAAIDDFMGGPAPDGGL
ncbi:MAG TPA: aspartyl/asparaginyl beta-hydroxylase domain-containing protein [Caulobacteraceae bacterium]|jgi:aspartyl/asparaginyl beta-hydroxylase (cupin superfamily)